MMKPLKDKDFLSSIPVPRWFVLGERKEGVEFTSFPGRQTSWDLAYDLLTGKHKKAFRISRCPLEDWQKRTGRLPAGFCFMQGYALSVSRDGIVIASETEEGYRNGMHTLSQLLVQAGGLLPHLEIIDWPDMETRCAHICYHLAADWMPESVPDFESLLELIKKLANFKYNAVLLEIEAMFPYKNFPEISNHESFSTGQIHKIKEVCSSLGVEIIPLMQCLGHAYSVLRLPKYARLRETPFSIQQYCPSNPDVLPFYTKLSRELIEGFSPVVRFHIGGDESRRLGICPSCRKKESEKGKGALYGEYVGNVANSLLNEGVIPLVWSDMFEHYPEALDYIPKNAEIVYWKYRLPSNRVIDFKNFDGHKLWSAPGVRFETSNHTMYKFTCASQGISFLAGEAKRNGCSKWLVTDWTKGIPYQLSLIGLAYGGEKGWCAGRGIDDFSSAYTNIVFGAENREWWRVYSLLEIILPYCEDAQARMNDRLDRYDLSGLTFSERVAKYTREDKREEFRDIMEEGLMSAEKSKTIMNSMNKKLKRSAYEWDILYLSAETNSHKARLGLAVDEAVCLLKYPVPGGPEKMKKLAVEFGELISEHDAIRKKTGRLLADGMFKSHARNLLKIKFEPAARGWMEYFKEALLKGEYLPGVLGEESAPRRA